MPFLNLKVAGTLSKEQKEQLVDEFTASLEKIAGKPKEATYIVIDEVPRQNFAKSGKLLD
ncbi:4-oxalocrotonate tautomerase [Candidatus Marinamargulisbacteria bacterium SCGC AG-343-D04]|nr:4-oxalocrotonate tautomerase [Candidatus Marinamargulisbacteria bacterium SCGC AG-343-D04]